MNTQVRTAAREGQLTLTVAAILAAATFAAMLIGHTAEAGACAIAALAAIASTESSTSKSSAQS